MGYPGRQNIYDATIRRMVQEALEQQEQHFQKEHETDTDEQLLSYLRTWAAKLNHTPWPLCCQHGVWILSAKAGHWVQT